MAEVEFDHRKFLDLPLSLAGAVGKLQERDLVAKSQLQLEALSNLIPLSLVHSDTAIGQKVLPFGSELVEVLVALNVVSGNQVHQIEQPVRGNSSTAVAGYVDKN
jgi:hypothetical protein